jgi:UDP-N-acetylglucosamine 2-epimerase (non-hydrolysing)
MKLYILVGTRPNFIKITQFKKIAAESYPNLIVKIIHTGQHYDEKMADVFFKQFNIEPDYFLNIAPNHPNIQVADILVKLQNLIDNIDKPDWLIVPGDVNSTMAGAIFANKNNIKLAHLEAGLRSFDNSMPEEHNRIVTDCLSDLFFITEQSGLDNLLNEKKNQNKIHFVGNTMIDTMMAFEKEIESSSILDDLNLLSEKFILLTMHRPATVDNAFELSKLLDLILSLSKKYKIVFPVHPRTLKSINDFGLQSKIEKVSELIFTEPLDYFAFQKLVKHCKFIITDSGGIQEESTFRKKPCLTLRPNTERPSTVDVGTNTLLKFDLKIVKKYIRQIETKTYKQGKIPKFWDGKSTQRIFKILNSL